MAALNKRTPNPATRFEPISCIVHDPSLRPMMLTRRLVLLNPGFLAVLACLSLAVSAISPSAGAQTPVVSRLETAFTLRENRTYDFGSRVVRCRPGQQIGIAAAPTMKAQQAIHNPAPDTVTSRAVK